MEYANVPLIHAVLMKHGLANLNELQTVYSASDAYYMYEITIVDNYNQRLADSASHR